MEIYGAAGKPTWQTWAFGVILAAYMVYGSVFIAQSSFIANGERYFSLFDDSMISMTYARNLAHGYGAVWNAGGERVEGYSNPLWMGYMALFHLLPLPLSKMSLFLQISGLVFMLLTLLFVRRIAEITGPDHAPLALIACLMTAFYYPLSNWSLLGTEVSVLLVVCTAGAWLALRMLDGRQFNPWLYVLLGVSTLVRFDMAVTYLTLWGFLTLFDRPNWKRHLIWGAGLLALFMGGQTLARLAYYGDVLPNTYYLKMTGFPLQARIARGLLVLGDFLKPVGWYFAALPLGVFLFRRDKKVWLLALLMLAQVAYSVYVGGDAWEHRGGANRFIALGMPFFMLLFAETLWQFAAFLRRWIARLLHRDVWLVRAAAWLGIAGVCFVALVTFNLLNEDVNWRTALANPGATRLRYALLMERSIYVAGSQRYTNDALVLRQITTPNARIAVVAAGNTPYYAERTFIDLLGKNDPVIARQGLQVSLQGDLREARPGHSKFDYRRSIGELKPDVIVEVFRSTDEQAAPYLGGYKRVKLNGQKWYLKADSTEILWDQVALLEQK